MPEELQTSYSASTAPLIEAMDTLRGRVSLATFGGVVGIIIGSEQPSDAQADVLRTRANDIQQAAQAKERALDELDGVMADDNQIIVLLKKDIAEDRTEATTLTAQARTVDTEGGFDVAGGLAGGSIGIAVAGVLAVAAHVLRSRQRS